MPYGDPEKQVEYHVAYRKANKERIKRAHKEWYDSERGQRWTRNKSYMKNYGITLEQFEEMFLRQNGVCAICKKPETRIRNGKIMNLHVDHCHDTGKVRGLLCNRCNSILGYCDENPEILSQAIKYLEV